jgi:glucose/arabinose dehydrogenase
VRTLVAALLLSLVACRVVAQETVNSAVHRFQVETIAEGFDHPWGVAKLPDGSYLVTERRGTMKKIPAGGGPAVDIAGVPPVFAQGQGGLLDIILHPDYAENGWIYFSFSKPIGNGALTSVVRARLDGNRLVDQETIFDPPADQATGGRNHFGCRIVFDGRGHLFFSLGDRGGPTNPDNLAQSLGSVTGKIHRIFDDGRIPPDNPFVGTEGAMPSIWAYGVRNPQGLVYDPATDRLWETEHGPRGGDELNLIRKGVNYGWPIVTHGINYSGTPISSLHTKAGMEDPVVEWTPVIAASGLALYRGDKFPRWRGNLFAGGLASQKLMRVQLNGTVVTRQEELLKGTGRIRDVRDFGDGFLYVLYDEPGKLVRLAPVD